MKRNLLFAGVIVLLVFFFAGCSLPGSDPIVGKWQQKSVNGVNAVLVTLVTFTETAFTGSTSGIPFHGVWTKSGSAYTMTGSFPGSPTTTFACTPVFSNSNNTLTFTDGNGEVEIFTRK